MDIRSEFEDWYTKAFGYPFNLTIRDGKYMNSDANSMWLAWQSATEAARGGGKSGVWQFFQDGEWHVGMNQLNHRENTEAAGYPVRDLYTQPPAPLVPEDAKERLRDAIAEAIGSNAFDCIRVWSAWSVGTMGPDDFVPVIDDEDRLSEIVDAALSAIKASTEAPAPVVPEGHYVVQFNPTEKQWSGLARDLIMWLDCASRPTGKSMYEHLSNVGVDVPEWLRDEVPDIDHLPAKGTRAAIIYKAMIMDYEP